MTIKINEMKILNNLTVSQPRAQCNDYVYAVYARFRFLMERRIYFYLIVLSILYYIYVCFNVVSADWKGMMARIICK